MRYLMFFMVMMLANVAHAMDCEKVPTCEELGYSTEEDPNCAENGYMYCPFDKTYKKCVNMDCEKLGFTTSDKTSWCGKLAFCPSDKSYTLCKALCEIGDVYYADGTCGYADNYDGSKTPVGVVYTVSDSGRHGKVINLHDLGRESENAPFNPENPYDTRYENFFWGYMKYDIPNLQNYDETNVVNRLKAYDPDLYDGKRNTDKILAAEGPECTYEESTASYYQYCIPQAAQAARDFYPQKELENDSKVGKGIWYLPALGELMELMGYDNANISGYQGNSGVTYKTKVTVNSTLTTLKEKNVTAETLTDSESGDSRGGYYWSSSEFSLDHSWALAPKIGYRISSGKVYDYPRLRASLQF